MIHSLLTRNCLLAMFFCLSLPLLRGQLPGPGNCIGWSPGPNHIAVPHAASLAPAGAFTVEGWFLPLSSASGNVTLLSKGNPFAGAGFSLGLDVNGHLVFFIGNAPSNATLVTPGPLDLYLWTHAAATYDGATLRLYVNGVEKASAAYAGGIGPNLDAFYMGLGYRGEMDEVRFWNAGLSAATLRDYMCRKIDASHPNAANLRGHWRFDDGMGTLLPDASAYGNDGALVGNLAWGPSAAPIGDASVHSYGATSFLEIAGPVGDTLRIDNWTAFPEGAHLYMVAQAPRVDTLQGPAVYYTALDTSHYFGYFFAVSNQGYPQTDVHYHFASNPFFNGQAPCDAGMAYKLNAAYPWWIPSFGNLDAVANVLHYPNLGRAEFIPALVSNRYGTLALPGTEACAGDSIQLLTGTGPGLSYQWYENGALLPNAVSDNYQTYSSGFYQVQVTDSFCTYLSDSVELVFHPLPVVSLLPSASLWECEDFWPLSNAQASPSGGTWTGPGISSDTFFTAAAGIGTFVLEYDVTDGNGCGGSASISIEVQADPVPALLIQPDVFCELDPVLGLAGTGFPLGGSYQGPGVSGTAFDPSQAGPGGHLLQYQYSISGTSCNFLAADSVWVLAAPMAPVISQSGGQLVSSQPNSTWYIQTPSGDSLLGTGGSWPIALSGLYFAVATDSNGCDSPPSNSEFVLVGLEGDMGRALLLYPNPAEGVLGISGLEPGIYRAIVRDQQGRVALEKEMEAGSQGEAEVDLQGLSAGLWHVELKSEGKRRYSGRFIKKK